MREQNRTWRRGGVVVMAAMITAPAWAGPGDHVRLGKSTITPSLQTGLDFHSNPYQSDGSAQSAPVVPALSWVTEPTVAVEFKGDLLQFNTSVGYQAKKTFDLDTSDSANLDALSRYSDFNVSFGGVLFPTGLVGLRLEERLANQGTPAEITDATERTFIVHTSNDLAGGVTIRPGTALNVDVLGSWSVDQYKVPEELLNQEDSPTNSNRQTYGPMLNIKWRFLPKTAFTSSSSLVWNTWSQNLIETLGASIGVADYGSYLAKPNSVHWRTSMGLRGQFTSKLGAIAEVGFGQAYYDEETVLSDDTVPNSSPDKELFTQLSENYARDLTSFGEGLLLNAQVSYSPQKGQTLSLGYQKSFQDAFFTNYVVYNNVALRYEGTFYNRLQAQGDFSYRLDRFHGEVARGDQTFRVKAGVGYALTPYLSTYANTGWTRRACADTDCLNEQFYPIQYDDFSGQLGLKVQY